MKKEKYDVFISYSRKDTPIVDKICHALDEQSITYFIDRKGLAGGSEFPAELEEAIDNSSIVLYIASNNSYQSKFTTGEINYAFNEKEKGYVIPYIIDNSDLLSIRGMKLIFTNVNIRNIFEHPIETTLMQDLCERLGLQYKEPESIRIEKERKLAEEKAKQEEELRKKILEEKKIQQEKLRKQQEEERIKREKELETLKKEQKRLMEDKRRHEELQTLEEADHNRRLKIREIELKRLEDNKIKENIQEKSQIVSNIKTLKKNAILAIASFVNLLVVFFYGDLVSYWLYGNGDYTFWGRCASPEEWEFTWENFCNYHKFDFLSNPIKFNWRDCIIFMSIFISGSLIMFSMMTGCLYLVGTKETPKDTGTAIGAYAGTFIFAMLGISVGLGYIYHSFFYGFCIWLLSIIVSILVVVFINRFINHHKNVFENE